MSKVYVHGFNPRENERLQDQAGTLVDLLHADTAYPRGSTVLEAGCGVGGCRGGRAESRGGAERAEGGGVAASGWDGGVPGGVAGRGCDGVV